MACNPPRLAPITRTRPGVIVPAAVGEHRKDFAAKYPRKAPLLVSADVAIEESTSMLCARVVRASIPREKEITPLEAISWMVSMDLRPQEPDQHLAGWRAATSSLPVFVIGSIKKDLSTISPRRTFGAARNNFRALGRIVGIRMPAANPVPASTTTCKPLSSDSG